MKAHHTTGPSWNKNVSDRIIDEYFQDMCGYYYFTVMFKLAGLVCPQMPYLSSRSISVFASVSS